MKLLAVDSNSIVNRAYYGIKLLSTKDGMFTNGIYGFLNIFLKLREEVQPDAVAFAFDLKAPTFRHLRYEGYKAQRKGMPAELASQIPVLKELLTALGYRVVEKEGFEADDILGTLSAAACKAGQQCVIATGDRDSLQLVNDCVTVRLAGTKMGRPETTVYDVESIREKYGVSPRDLIEVKALMGDSSDNIPGVAGIGEKTALALISQYQTVDKLYEALENGTAELKPAVRTKLTQGKEQAYLSRELATICCEAPMETDLAYYLPSPPDTGTALKLFKRLEMFSMPERFALDTTQFSTLQSTENNPKAWEITVLSGDENAPLTFSSEKPLHCLFEWEDEKITGMAVIKQDTIEYFSNLHPAFENRLREVLECGIPLATNNSKWVFKAAMERGLPIPQIEFDLSLAAYLLSPSSSEYSVSRLGLEYGVPKPQLLTELTPSPFFEDCAVFLRLSAILTEKLRENNQSALLREVELPLAEVLASMELIGFALDSKGLKQFGEGLDAQIAELTRQIYEYSGYEFNINSPKQLGEVLFERLGLPTRKKTKSGYSTNADVLESLAEHHPIIPLILEYRKVTKLKSTYVEGLLKVVGPDGRIHTKFIQTETRTGRISSIEPNLQNIPIRTELGSNLRRFFHARPGCLLVDADYSQIELRVLAHIADDKNMIDAFQHGEDIHTNTAAQVFGLPPLFVTPLMRSRAKAVNFGIVYGIGAFSLSKDIGVSVSEADSYIKNYLKTYSGVKKYMDGIIRFGTEHGYVQTLLNRRRYLPELASSNKITKALGERIAMNTPIQGSAADIIKLAMVQVYRRLKQENLRSRLVLQVHDELIVEAVEEEVEQVKELLRYEMEHAIQLKVEIPADVNAGQTWFDAK